jgi:glycosyltransferase involved in cell wall biosynthesis
VLRAALPGAPPLVLCGKLGWQPELIRANLDQGTREGWLIHLGYAPDPVLRTLYERAAVLACPSLYEGFGLPLIEAMAAGTPVVCSDIPVFREVAANAALFAAPDNASRWAHEIGRVLADPELVRDLQEKGHTRAATFSWKRTADQTLAVWAAAADA